MNFAQLQSNFDSVSDFRPFGFRWRANFSLKSKKMIKESRNSVDKDLKNAYDIGNNTGFYQEGNFWR